MLASALFAATLISASPPMSAERLTASTRVEPEDVSVLALVANPGAYDGRAIRTIGYLNLEFEGDALYVDRQAFNAAMFKNSVWIERPRWVTEEHGRALSRRYALVEGVFHADQHGHLGMHSGTIEDISRLQAWPSRAEMTCGPPPLLMKYVCSLLSALIAAVVAGRLIVRRRTP